MRYSGNAQPPRAKNVLYVEYAIAVTQPLTAEGEQKHSDTHLCVFIQPFNQTFNLFSYNGEPNTLKHWELN